MQIKDKLMKDMYPLLLTLSAHAQRGLRLRYLPCLLSHISPLERLFVVLKIVSRTQWATEVWGFLSNCSVGEVQHCSVESMRKVGHFLRKASLCIVSACIFKGSRMCGAEGSAL